MVTIKHLKLTLICAWKNHHQQHAPLCVNANTHQFPLFIHCWYSQDIYLIVHDNELAYFFIFWFWNCVHTMYWICRLITFKWQPFADKCQCILIGSLMPREQDYLTVCIYLSHIIASTRHFVDGKCQWILICNSMKTELDYKGGIWPRKVP